MYHYLLVFLDPKENYKVLGYQAFSGDSVIYPQDVIPESKKLEFKLLGYLPDSSANSKYELLGSPTYDTVNNILLIEFSGEMGGVSVEVARYDSSDPLSIDLEISKILSVKRQEIFQVVGLFNEEQDFSVIGYVTYFGSMLKDPDNDVQFAGNEWVIALDKYTDDSSDYHSAYQRLNCHYDKETKKLHIEIPNLNYVTCRMSGYPSRRDDIDKIIEMQRREGILSAMEDDLLEDLLGMGILWLQNKAPSSFGAFLFNLLFQYYLF